MRDEVTADDEKDYRRETAKFIDESNMIVKLEEIKEKLSDKLEACCGRDELDSLRQRLKRKRFWEQKKLS